MRSNGSAGILTLLGGRLGKRAGVDGFSSFNGGASSLGVGRGGFTWFGLKAANIMGAVANVSESTAGESKTAASDAAADTSGIGPVGKGSGADWFMKFLYSKGLRGDDLRTMWSIGMRESSGVPGTVSSMDGLGMGLFQIQSGVHDEWIKKHYGWTIEEVRRDNDKNFQIMLDLSDGSGDGQVNGAFSNLVHWGHRSSKDPSLYAKAYSRWTPEQHQAWIVQPFEKYYGQFSDVAKEAGIPGYSEGAYRTHEGMAKLHEGEMVLPATVAEQFRQMMRSASGPGSGGQQTVNINLKIERASDEEAERFARRVKKLMEEDNWATAVRSA